MSFGKAAMAELQRNKDKQELIPYILDYLKTHEYIKVRAITYIYIKKNYFKHYNDFEKNNFKRKIHAKLSSYFAILTREGYIKPYSKSSTGTVYKRTDDMIKGFNNILEEIKK